MAAPATVPESTVKRAIKLLETGRATMAEIAALCGVTRQSVAFWCTRAGIDPVKARREYLRRLWKS